MDELFKLVIIGITAAIFSLTIKKFNEEMSVLVLFGAGLLISFSIIKSFFVIKNFISDLTSAAGISSQTFEILLKVIGISLLTKIGSEVCKDANSASLSLKIELLGSVIAMITALPLFSSLLKLIQTFT